jgi:hypothetical protein
MFDHELLATVKRIGTVSTWMLMHLASKDSGVVFLSIHGIALDADTSPCASYVLEVTIYLLQHGCADRSVEFLVSCLVLGVAILQSCDAVASR